MVVSHAPYDLGNRKELIAPPCLEFPKTGRRVQDNNCRIDLGMQKHGLARPLDHTDNARTHFGALDLNPRSVKEVG